MPRRPSAFGTGVGLVFCLISAAACDQVETLGMTVSELGPNAGGQAGDSNRDTPRLVAAVSDPASRDTDPSFTADRLELYFTSDRQNGKDIWRSFRATPDQPLGAPELVKELSSSGQDENARVSSDGRDVWFFTDRNRALGAVWHSSRASSNEPWSEPEPVSALTTGEGSSDVSVTVDATRQLFVLNSKVTGNLPYGLYQFERDGVDGPFSAPRLLEEVVSSADEFDPDLRDQGRFLAFASLRLGHSQLFWARRPALDQPFEPPVTIPAFRSEYEDGSPCFSDDLTFVMFSSDRAGSVDIYEATVVTPTARP